MVQRRAARWVLRRYDITDSVTEMLRTLDWRNWNPEELMLVCVSYITSEMVWLMDMKTDCSLLATK